MHVMNETVFLRNVGFIELTHRHGKTIFIRNVFFYGLTSDRTGYF